MNVLSKIHSRLQSRRVVLEREAWASLNSRLPSFEGQMATESLRLELRSLLIHDIKQKVCDPFSLDVVTDFYNRWNVKIDPLMTPAEIAERDAECRRIDEEVRVAEIIADKQKAAAHQSSAGVYRVGYTLEAHVSIPGMIEDLHHWQVPPHLYNEESVGFRQAIDDVIRYLRVREKRG